MILNKLEMTYICFSMMIMLIMFSINSFFMFWVLLEMMMMMYIPILSKYNSNNSLKYFFIQTFSSILMLFSIIMSKVNVSFNFILGLSLFLKIGVAPFHFWFLDMLYNINYVELLLLMTLQKLPGFYMISYYFSSFKNLMLIVMLISAVIGAIMGFSSKSIFFILGASSLSHSSWIMLAMLNNNLLWLSYFIMYSIMLTMLMIMLNNMMLKLFNFQIMYKIEKNKQILLFFIFLSLGGIPPFSGFILKWIVLFNTYIYWSIILGIMVILVLIILYYYMMLFMNSILMSSSMLMFNSKINKVNLNFVYSNIIIILITPFFMILFY
uniref:NADH-ubiquinone oxidoreductase chain 2 n=1 Tax=Bathynella cf. rufa JHS-2017 TaxID=2029186 RepID=A0A7R6D7L6_9CRUS|nr:NADH dehydrogenase subunit 2 [Bathynella cf. rufa JHS-2017]